MHLQKKLLLIFTVTIAFTACNNAELEERGMQEYVASADSMATSTAPDIADLASDSRKVIRKADIKCRVNDVPQAVKELETFTAQAGGFVAQSHTQNSIINEKSAAYKTDSFKTVQSYRTTANMVIRIPYYALDTLADHISKLSTFIHHRDMNRQDVTLQYLSNLLKNRETPTTNQPAKTAKSNDANAPVVNEKHEQVDRKIANLEILDDTRYATLALEIYQPEQVIVSITQNTDKLLSPGFGERAGDALNTSIEIIKSLTLAAIAIWPIWLTLIIFLLWYKSRKNKGRIALTKSLTVKQTS